EPRVQRQHGEGVAEAPGQRVRGVADLALAAEEHEDVARPLGGQLGHRVADRVELVRASAGGRYRVSTGYVRPETSTTGAPSKWRLKRSGSIVADVMISFRSGRRGRI